MYPNFSIYCPKEKGDEQSSEYFEKTGQQDPGQAHWFLGTIMFCKVLHIHYIQQTEKRL